MKKTVLVTGASQGIGAGLVRTFQDRGYHVVANSRHITEVLKPSANLALVDGDIAEPSTARRIAATAMEMFGSIDALVNNAGIFVAKPFVEYTAEDFRQLVATNLEGFLFLSQLATRQMLAQGNGGSIVNISSSLVDNPIASMPASVSMITKGGLDAASRNLAMEYATQKIRVNVVAPGIVNTPMHKDNPKDFLRTLSPLAIISEVQEIVDAVVFLTEASSITGEVLHVDGGMHLGKW